MLIGTGCGIPGVMASRTIENERDRRMTIMTTTFIPCGAKVPFIGMIAGALFGGSAWVSTAAYCIEMCIRDSAVQARSTGRLSRRSRQTSAGRRTEDRAREPDCVSGSDTVSYTHLDVYKRQLLERLGSIFENRLP